MTLPVCYKDAGDDDASDGGEQLETLVGRVGGMVEAAALSPKHVGPGCLGKTPTEAYPAWGSGASA